ncbi:predicted protein [Nematostella vectensis]|uniref:F5/8 type C domain-containing protein n=1 Tax=Nematostella vectensis TaxID=45351 RepID=A7RX61_NEMVE|nr:predicted protein [Nematostella vectensis]|eukprot:XP_001635971.1 predicted protein [Nematostella vectensis]
MPAYNARLNNDKAWAAGNRQNQFLQVDFGRQAAVVKIATQGHPKWALQQWVRSYTLSSSEDGQVWRDHVAASGETVFQGNTNPNGIVTNTVSPPLEGRYVRINTKKFSNFIAMRIELYGCFTVQ